MTITIQKVINVLGDESETFDCTLTDSEHAKYVCLSFATEPQCDAFIASAMAADDVERSDDYRRET